MAGSKLAERRVGGGALLRVAELFPKPTSRVESAPIRRSGRVRKIACQDDPPPPSFDLGIRDGDGGEQRYGVGM
jgi:hypothetical protein